MGAGGHHLAYNTACTVLHQQLQNIGMAKLLCGSNCCVALLYIQKPLVPTTKNLTRNTNTANTFYHPQEASSPLQKPSLFLVNCDQKTCKPAGNYPYDNGGVAIRLMRHGLPTMALQYNPLSSYNIDCRICLNVQQKNWAD